MYGDKIIFLLGSFFKTFKYALSGIFFTLLLSGIFFSADGQDIDPHITFLSSKSDIKTANLEIVDITVKVQNKGKVAIDGYFDIKITADLKLLSKNHVAVLLMPGDSLFLPVKIFASKKAAADKANPVVMQLINDKKIIAETGCTVHINIKKSVSLTPLVSGILLNPQTDTINIPINVSNAGNTAQKVSVIAEFPYRVEGADNPYTIEIFLLPSADTLIYFKRAVNRKMLSSDEFDVTLTGLYADGEIFGMGYTKVQSAKGARHYVNENYTDNSMNTISLSSQNMFAQNESYLFNGRGDIDLPGRKLRYSFDITTYRNNYSLDMIRNTYIDFETHNMGLIAGNITRNYEINLSGQGAAFFLNDTTRHNLYEAGYISANTNLFQRTPAGFPSLGTASWFSAGHKNKRWDVLSTFLMQNSPFLNTNSLIFSNKFNWHSQKFNLSLNINGGHTADLISNAGKYSIAAGLNLSGKIEKWEYTSINYISTGYYPGVSRGATTFSERISHIETVGSEWISLDYFNYLPNYFSNSFSYLPKYSNLRMEIGKSKKIKTLTLSIAPTYSKETNNSYLLFPINIPPSQQANTISIFRSVDLHAIMSYPISLNKYLTINMQGGMYNSSINNHYQLHYNFTSIYTDPIFNINASVQFGNINLGETMNNYIHPGVLNRIIMVASNVHTTFFKKKALAETGITYLNSSLYGSSLLLTGRISYNILPKTTIYLAVNHNRYAYEYGAFHNSIFEAGITQKLPSMKVMKKSMSLEIFVYKDNNHNSVFDVGDSVSANTLVYINDMAFITRGNGTISYKGLPAGNYHVSVSNNKGWYAPDQYINFKNKLNLQIPLERTGTIKGGVVFSFKEFSYEIRPEKSGITVTATDENNKVYNTMTGPDGQYAFYIPAGAYIINCSQESLPPEIECTNNNSKVEVKFNTENVVNFDLNIKSRKIEIKRFVSPAVQREREKRK